MAIDNTSTTSRARAPALHRTPHGGAVSRRADADRAVSDAADATAAMLDLVLRVDSVEEHLAEVARMAADVSPDIGATGVTVLRGGELFSVATSDPLGAAGDQLQYDAREGPSLDSLTTGELLVVRDYRAEDRWPTYTPRAVARGVRSSLTVPLRAAGSTVGALSAYGTEPDVFVGALRDAVVDFGRRAGNVVGIALRQAEQVSLVDDLHAAMESRSVIDQALGIVMAQQRCTADEAFAILRRASQGRNRRLADIARDVVTTVSGGPPRTGRFTR
ncbi:GAF and ANTAR domain-containing protein [Cellulomonas shaoxiangyii]|uniref:ANTAR domain-containing protein n=1 Tax=Cellulomonas shaoxiangyii TaxID=2566013 RepID=A0A4P7SGG3_9CELL|nr:GAF and ANTAR domain-containing protein [Cellulomonas shaoxiangyii]QCB93062.1 ANTAR domain-containing protein [Cellulomonas shaoxiangyii]TGY82993.1 ANTAR domain-containing protein [Cellulomonas shaoxiangyii]